MTLRDWRSRTGSIGAEVRSILEAQNRTDLDTASCRKWAREFIQALVPGWQCGIPLTPEQARLVGKAFGELQYRPQPSKKLR